VTRAAPGGGRPRTAFFGTPSFSVPGLEALAESTEVVRVFSQPDRPKGRGMKRVPTPVKARALELGLPVEQPRKVRTREFAEALRALELDLAVVIAFGRILPRAVLDAPRLGCVNVHASLLPRWRGAAPIQWAIAAGDDITGVCLMQMDEGMDTGPVLRCMETTIRADETAGELAPRLSALGASLIRESLPAILAGAVVPTPQPEERATLAPMLTKEDGTLDLRQPAQRVHDRVRGMSPWPGAQLWLDGTRWKVHRTRVLDDDGPGTAPEPGRVHRAGPDGLDLVCGDGRLLRLVEVQLEGRRRMPVSAVLAGHPVPAGARFSLPESPPSP